MSTHTLTPAQAEQAALLADARALDKRIRNLAKHRRKNTVAIAYGLKRMHDRRLHQSLGFGSVAEYAVKVGATSSRTHARELLALIQQLERLPKLRRLFREGRADWTKLREAARAATPETEDQWIAIVLEKPYSEVRKLSRLERGEAPTVRRSHELTLEEDASLQAAIRRVREASRESLTDAQALKIICDGAADTGRVVIQRCPDCRKAFQETPEGPVEVPPETLAMVECDAEILDISDGRPASITRTIPPKVANFVHGRDRGRCRWPGCTNMQYLHIHHEGGRENVGHDPDRMMLLCPSHHDARHRGSIRIEPLGRGAFYFMLADGTRVHGEVSRETPEEAVAAPVTPSEVQPVPDVG